ncbi:MAG: hypothetical protein WB662_03810 [Methyloceanibacter sp.]
MGKVIASVRDPIHLSHTYWGSLKLTIGPEHRRGNRNVLLDAKEARILAYALLMEAERLEVRKRSTESKEE